SRGRAVPRAPAKPSSSSSATGHYWSVAGGWWGEPGRVSAGRLGARMPPRSPLTPLALPRATPCEVVMNTSRLPLGAALLLSAFPLSAGAAELPKAIDSAPCAVAPTIDGVIGADEWKGATAVKFDLKMVRLKPPGTTTWACELRVMNSANALYVALRVPD